MQLRYGFNEIDGWAAFSMGEHREQIRRRLQLMGTQVIRVFVFDKPVPDPFKEWHLVCRRAAGRARRRRKADGDVRQVPSALRRPGEHPQLRRALLARSSGAASSSGAERGEGLVLVRVERAEQSGSSAVTSLYAQYRRIYEEVAAAVLELLEPHLGGRKARIGGPSIDGTQRAFWMDWIAQLVADVDNRMIGFVNWHMYADWRPAVPSETLRYELWGSPDAPNGEVFEALAMAQTPQYEARARGVARLLHGRDILNVCGELNTVAHHEHCLHARPQPERVRRRLLRLRAHPSDPRRCGPGDALDRDIQTVGLGRRDDAYGLMTISGEPTPACLGQATLRPARAVWRLDPLSVAPPRSARCRCRCRVGRQGPPQRCVRQHGAPDRGPWRLRLGRRAVRLREILRLDASTGDRVAREPFDGTVRLKGYGVAVVTNVADTEVS